MRKFSKILAVLLTVCVLCGVVASFAVSADDGDLTPTLKYATGLGTANMIDNNGTSINSQSNSRYALGTARETGMGYVKVYPNPAEAIPTGYDGAHPVAGLTLNMFHDGSAYRQGVAGRDDFGTNTEDLTFMEYMTVDMDFGVDAYRYVYVDEYGKTVKTIDATAVEGMTEVDSLTAISDTKYFKELAMPENYFGRFETYVGMTEQAGLGSHYVRQDEKGDWYVCQNTTVASSSWKYKLAGEVGKYDHFTWVWHVIDSDPDSLENDLGLKVYFYVNGEYVATVIDSARLTHKIDANGDGTKETVSAYTVSIKRYYYSFTKADFKTEDGNTTMTTGEAYASFAWRNDYSFQFKNIAMNYYTPEDLEKTTLDEFIEGADYNSNLYGVTNIVANENYVTPNYKDGYVEYGGKTFYFTGLGLAYAADAMKSGETLTVSGISVEDFAPKGNVANFFVKCINGASFATTESYDKYAYTDTSLDLYIVNETLISGKDRLNITNDPENRYNDYADATTSGSNGGSVINDGDHVGGVKYGVSNGYYRIYGTGGVTKTANNAGVYWAATRNTGVAAANRNTNLFDASFSVADFELGTDKYVFSYTADVVRTVVATGSKITNETTTETLTGVTLYKTVSTKAEFEAFVKNPASLAGTQPAITTSNGSNWKYVATDVVSNVVIDANSLTLAYLSGTGIGASVLSSTTAVESQTDTSKASRCDTFNFAAYFVQDTKTGLWYISDSTGAYSADNTNILLSNEVGVTDHITVIYDNGVQSEGCISYTLYVNGEYLSSGEVSNAANSNIKKNAKYITNRGIGLIIPGGKKAVSNYSFMMDDFAFNIYRNDVVLDDEATEDVYVGAESWTPYASGDLYGVDDLIADLAQGNKYSCTKALDLYYNETLITRDGWVSVDNGKTVLVSPTQINEALANVTDYAEIITSRKITLASLPEGVYGLYIRPVRNGGVTLAGELATTHLVVDYMEGLLELRELLEDEKLTITFKDEAGNVFHTTILTPGTALVPPAYKDNVIDLDTGVVTGFVKWQFEEIDDAVEGYYFSGYVEAGAQLTAVPVVSELGVIDTFAIYKLDSDGAAILYGDLDTYSEFTVEKVNEALTLIPTGDKAILALLYDGAVDLGGGAKFTTIKSHFTFDLNGRTLVFSKDFADTGYGAYPFTIGDGAFFNLISSKAGGEIYMARYAGEGKEGQAWANGIIQLAGSSVKNATINVGAYDANGNKCEDYAGNFSLYGGSLAFLGGGGATPAEATVTLNVNGAEFYHALRSGYAVVVGRYNDLYVNFYNSKFYSNSSVAYGVYYDYSASSYSTKSIIKAYDCEFYAAANGSIELDGTSHFVTDRPIFSIQKNSSIYLEGCKLVGGNNSFATGQVTLGPDNLIAGLDASKVTLAEGVSMLDLEGAYISGEFTHPPMFFVSNDYDTLVDDGKGGFVMNPDILDKSKWLTTGTSCGNAFMTYSSDKDAPAYELANVELYTADGELYKTLPWLVGEKFYASVDMIQENFYFIYDLAWATEGGEAVEGTVVNADLKAYVAGATTYFQGLSGMQANLTLKSDMKFNLYIPARDGIAVNGVSLGNVLPNLFTIGDKQYYVVVVDLTAGNFDAFEIDVYLLAEDVYTGEIYEFVDALTIDYVKSYASVAAKSAACGSETAVLLKEIIDYNVAVAKYLDASFDEAAVESIVAFREIYAAHNVADDPATEDVDESKSCVCSVALPEVEATDLSGVASYITDATYYLDSNVGVMGLILYVAEGYEGADLTVSFVDVDGKEVFAEVEYIADEGYIMVSNIKAAYIDDVMTVTIGEAVGTYSLATYIAECEDVNAKAVAGALLEYSIAAEAYKASLRAE